MEARKVKSIRIPAHANDVILRSLTCYMSLTGSGQILNDIPRNPLQPIQHSHDDTGANPMIQISPIFKPGDIVQQAEQINQKEVLARVPPVSFQDGPTERLDSMPMR